ncbi:hypothetical protein MP228_012850 [Amoeboaphelidium protococcarum]|nr:hypothetical protein MP228_012850 [Amoeboaphelidium protococcarum]
MIIHKILVSVAICLPYLISGQSQSFIVRNSTDSSLRIGHASGLQYKSVGASLYPYWVGTLNDYAYRLMLTAVANGITSFRAVLIFEQNNRVADPGALWSDYIWRPLDSLIYQASLLDTRVTVELSGLANWMENVQLDPFSATNYYLWDQLVDFVGNRTNTYSGIKYTEDPTILMFTVLGEVQPSPRSKQAPIFALLQRVAARLRSLDKKHLIGSGGLLHMSSFSGYNDPVTYWKTIYSDPNVDVCMIHVYQDPNKVLLSNGAFAKSEWDNLATYASFCRDLGKPFVVDEFGLNFDAYSRSRGTEYIKYAFDKAFNTSPPISMIQLWNWRAGKTFDVYPREDLLILEIVRDNAATRWGFGDGVKVSPTSSSTSSSTQSSKLSQVIVNNPVVFDSNSFIAEGPALVTDFQSLPQTPNQKVLLTPEGFVLERQFIFTSSQYDTDTITLPADLSDWSMYGIDNGKLICEVMIEAKFPLQPVGHGIKFSVNGKSGRAWTQTNKPVWTNALVLYQWNQIYMRLDPEQSVISEELAAYPSTADQWRNELSDVSTYSISLVHQSGLPAMNGAWKVRNCRLDTVQSVDMLISDALQYPSVKNVTVFKSSTVVVTATVVQASPCQTFVKGNQASSFPDFISESMDPQILLIGVMTNMFAIMLFAISCVIQRRYRRVNQDISSNLSNNKQSVECADSCTSVETRAN